MRGSIVTSLPTLTFVSSAEGEKALKTFDAFRLEPNLWEYLEQFSGLVDTVEAQRLIGSLSQKTVPTADFTGDTVSLGRKVLD